MLRSVRLRLTLWYVLLLAIILMGFSAGVYVLLRQNLYDNLDGLIQNRANTFLAIVHYEGDRPTLAGRVSSDDLNADESFVRVFDASGDVTFDNINTAAAIDSRAVGRALRGETSTRTVTVDDETMRVWTLPIQRGEGIGGVLEVGQAQDDVSDTLQALLLILAIAYPATLAAASLGGIFLAGRALSPIDSLTRLARRISAEDLGERLDLQLPEDEVGRLARTFDEMIARLDEAFRRQRQFTADASHELRTPLTVIKGHAEVALSKPRDAAAYREVLEMVNEEVDRLIRMVGSLLTLARADAGQIPIASDVVSLGDLVTAAVEQVCPMAARRSLDLKVDPGPVVTLQADEDLLLQLLLNLLDNGLKYTPSGGAVTAGWDTDDVTAELWVRDTGVGIDKEHMEHIFDRFYRVDRTRSQAEGGAGLGLSICQWIVDAHGGSIAVESKSEEGTQITVVFPLSRTASNS